MSSAEYDSNKDKVDLMQVIRGVDRNKFQFVKSGPVQELRQEFPELRPIARVYCLYNGELRMLSVLGTSQYNKTPQAGLNLLYEYLSSFDHSKNERAYKFHTMISPWGPVRYTKGSGFLLNFSRGEVITDIERELVGKNLELLDRYFKDLEAYSHQFDEKPKDGVIKTESVQKPAEAKEDFETSLQPPPPEELPIIQQGDDINVEDIPF